MARSRAARLEALERRYDPAHRYVDIAVQFHVCELVNGEPVWTDRASRIYGGRWDKELGSYVDPDSASSMGPLRVLHMECTGPQFEYVTSGARWTEISGGRGLGKSYGGLLVIAKNACDRPFVDGRLVSPTERLFLVQWNKIVPQLLSTGWLIDGEAGVKEGAHELWFWNGVVVQFVSGHKPERLPSWGGGWVIDDEEQYLKDRAIKKLIYCLREGGGGGWQFYSQLTPEPGEPLKRHDERVVIAAENPADAKVIHSDSRSNIFADQDVYDWSGRRQSREEYAIEVLGDWEIVRQLEAKDAPRPVFACLVQEWERYERGETGLPHEWLGGDTFEDVTRQVAQAKFGARAGYSWRYIGGLDPGTAVPNELVIWKVFRRRHGDDRRNYWVAWDVLTLKGHCGHMAEYAQQEGYGPRDLVVVPDFSAWGRSYVRQENGSGRASKGLGVSAAAMFRAAGNPVPYHVAGGRVNPRIKHSIDDAMEKADPAIGPPRLLFRLPEAAPLFQNMATVVWDKGGKDFDPAVPNDKTDAGRYPISFIDPAARIGAAPRLSLAR